MLRQLPQELRNEQPGWLIEDHYIAGTRLRLRRMSLLDGGETLYKVGQKYRAPSQSAAERTMTNMYLNEVEYEKLSHLAANSLVKKRYRYIHDEHQYAVDVFEGPLWGLILAEVECETLQEYQLLQTPSFALREVTSEPFFGGGNLAGLTREAFLQEAQKWLAA